MNAKEASKFGAKFYSTVSGLRKVFEGLLDNGLRSLNSRAMNLQLTTNIYRNIKPGEARSAMVVSEFGLVHGSSMV